MQLRQGRYHARFPSQVLLWKQQDPGPHKQEAGVNLPATKEISMGSHIVLKKLKPVAIFFIKGRTFSSMEIIFCIKIEGLS